MTLQRISMWRSNNTSSCNWWKWKEVFPLKPTNDILYIFELVGFWILKVVYLFAVLTRSTFSNFFLMLLSIKEYNSREKPVCYEPFKNRQFVKVCTEKIIDYQFRENGARNIYSDCNQMKVYYSAGTLLIIAMLLWSVCLSVSSYPCDLVFTVIISPPLWLPCQKG